MGSSSRYNLLSIGTEEDGLDRRTVDEGLDDLTLEAELDGGASEADSAVQATRAAEVPTPAPTPAPKRTATRKPPTRKTAGSSTTRSASSNGTRASSNGSGKAKPDDKPLSDETLSAETLSAAVDPEPAATAAEEPSSDGEPQRPADQRPADLADASEAGKAGEEKKDEPESPTAVIPAMPADDIFAPRPGKTAASAASAVEPSPLAAEPSPRTEGSPLKGGSPLKEGWGTVKPGERPRGNAFDVDDAFSAPPMPPDQTVRTSPFTSSKSSSPKLSAASADASGPMAASQTSTAPSQAFPRPAAAGPATKGKPKATVRRSTARQAHLTISRVEPWSVMKFSFAVSVVAFIVLFVAVAVLFAVLSALGVFDSLQHLVNNVTSSQNSAGYNVKKWFTASRVLGYTVLLGGLNIVLITAMSTIGAVIYNLTSRLIGGVEVTLKETD